MNEKKTDDLKISTFGLGYVSCVSLGCLSKNGFNVIGVDVNETKVTQINNGHATIVENEIDEFIKEQINLNRIEATEDAEYAILNSDISILCIVTQLVKINT